MASEPATLRGNGQSVGRYRILNHIASGGMGAVYLAYDPVLNRTVALKVLSPEMAAKPNMVQRFQREAKAAAKLKHENIVQIFDFGEAGGTFFLALEFVDGTDLLDYIEQRPGGRLDIDETIHIAIQAAKALDHAFAQGIVHRDIKPSNFLVTMRGGKLFVKLTDLGLAREAADARITRDNTTLGTVDYISPEQARDSGAADARSDIYSLGCSLYHMLVGHPPFPKGTLVEKIQHHLCTPAPDIRDHRNDASDRLSNILDKMLAKDPAERYETPLHLLHDLMTREQFAAYLESTREIPRPAFQPPVHSPRRTSTAPTIYQAPDDLPDPDPLFPADFRVADDTAEAMDDPTDNSGVTPAPTVREVVRTAVAAANDPVSVELESVELESVELEPLESVDEIPAPTEPPPLDWGPLPAVKEKTSPTKVEPRKNGRKRTTSAAAQKRGKRIEQRRVLQTPLWFGGIVAGLLFAAFIVWAAMTLLTSRRAPGVPRNVDEDLNRPPVVARP